MWWQKYFTPADWAAFCHQLTRYFEELNKPVTLDAEQGTLTAAEGHRYGLQNLAQRCALAQPAEWPAMMAEHFRYLVAAHAEWETSGEALKSFASANGLLAVRVWPVDYLNSLGPDKLIFREDLEGTITALVLDFPNSIRNLTPDEVSAWGKTKEELFRVALSNTLENYPPEVQEQALPEDVKVWVFLGENFYVASQALLLEHFPQCLGTHGAIVGVPRRQTLLCYPINSISVLNALNYLPIISNAMEKEGPGSITPNVYWYHKGRFVNLPYELTETTYSLTPPEEFVEMLNSLAGEA